MSDFIIATASTCDLDASWLKEHNVEWIPYSFDIDGEVYQDDCTSESKNLLFKAMRENKLPNTSQINLYSYFEFFMKLLATGKPVIYADMTKMISGSYANSLQAAEMIKQEHPEYQLTIIDTRCVTTGLGLLIREMVEQRDAGKLYEEVIEYANDTKFHIVHRFMIEKLKWLQRGGRLSNASVIVGSLLLIKPLIYIPEDGSLVAYDKVRGRRRAIKALVEAIGNDIGDPSGKEIIVCHADCLEDAEKMKEMIIEKYQGVTVTIQELGAVIGCHVGPDFLSTVYKTEKQRIQ